jgi:hypothetical protein
VAIKIIQRVREESKEEEKRSCFQQEEIEKEIFNSILR